jgi:hypothetical protein
MRIEIILPDGDLRREIWEFSISIDSCACIYFDYYSYQTRESTRKRLWHKQTHWDRLDGRNNNISRPVLPPGIEADMRKRYQEYILTLPIQG